MALCRHYRGRSSRLKRYVVWPLLLLNREAARVEAFLCYLCYLSTKSEAVAWNTNRSRTAVSTQLPIVDSTTMVFVLLRALELADQTGCSRGAVESVSGWPKRFPHDFASRAFPNFWDLRPATLGVPFPPRRALHNALSFVPFGASLKTTASLSLLPVKRSTAN